MIHCSCSIMRIYHLCRKRARFIKRKLKITPIFVTKQCWRVFTLFSVVPILCSVRLLTSTENHWCSHISIKFQMALCSRNLPRSINLSHNVSHFRSLLDVCVGGLHDKSPKRIVPKISQFKVRPQITIRLEFVPEITAIKHATIFYVYLRFLPWCWGSTLLFTVLTIVIGRVSL